MGFFEDNFAEGSKKAPSSPHIQWEYLFISFRLLGAKGTEYDCNRLGKEGWEMCAYSDNTGVAVFKRPKYDYDE